MTTGVFASPQIATEIVATMREPFAILDEHLELIAASPAFFSRFRLASLATVGTPVFAWGQGEWDTPSTHDLFERLAPFREAVEKYTLDIRFRGTERPLVEVSVRPVRQGGNQVTAYLCTFAEVKGEKERGYAALLESLRRRAGDLIALVDTSTGRLVHADGAAVELTGYTTGELLGAEFSSLIKPKERTLILEAFSKLAASETHDRLTFRIRHRDGRELWVEALCDGCRSPSGERLVHVAARDVSDRKRAEESLRWITRQTKLILDSAADGILGLDPRGRITFINPAGARLLGGRVSEFLGKRYDDLIEFDEDAGDEIADTLTDGLARDIGAIYVNTLDGRRVLTELACSTAREGQQITAGVVCFRDITERHLAEEKARRAQWLAGVGETTLGLRHEVNNPLTSLLGEAHLLELGGNTAEEEREMISAMCEDARRISTVIRRLTERQNDPIVLVEEDLRMLDLGGG